jgi:hypothetical protein
MRMYRWRWLVNSGHGVSTLLLSATWAYSAQPMKII